MSQNKFTSEIAINSSFLPGEVHGDPADRILIATAIAYSALKADLQEMRQLFSYTGFHKRLDWKQYYTGYLQAGSLQLLKMALYM